MEEKRRINMKHNKIIIKITIKTRERENGRINKTEEKRKAVKRHQELRTTQRTKGG